MYKTIEELIGEVIISCEHWAQEVVFETKSGRRFQMYHQQDCCESVEVAEFTGKEHLIGHRVLKAKEVIGHDNAEYGDSITLSDYYLKTEVGEAVIKWIGQSNGYYSEEVYFIELK